MAAEQTSALYTGWVHHHRPDPGAPRLRHRLRWLYLMLDELDDLNARPILSASRAPAPVHLRRRDYLGAAEQPLDEAVRDTVEAALGQRPRGRIALLGSVRTLGWLFNPLCMYYCFAPDAPTPEAAVLEVTNTPWHERTAYVLPLPTTSGTRIAKRMRVSPFMPNDGLEYRVHLGTPGCTVTGSVSLYDGDRPLLATGFSLNRRPLTRAALLRHIVATDSARSISMGIYTSALRLWLHGRRQATGWAGSG